MLLSREWTNFARYRKGLRVSSPQGSQRRTFWLSLPYAYNLPLLVLASTLHWLISETISYEELNVLDGSQVVETDSHGRPISSLTASSLNGVFGNATVLLILLVFLMSCIVVVIGLGFRRYAGGIPIVRSNSLALYRACHEQPNQQENSFEPIAWGIRPHSSDESLDIGLSSGEIELMDPSSLKFNPVQRLIYRCEKGFHGKVAGVAGAAGRLASFRRRP
jgi:hypothetical protein